MAITKKAAKKAVPKVVEEPKQIVLTQDQYDELTGLKWDINNVSNELKNIINKNEIFKKITYITSRETLFSKGGGVIFPPASRPSLAAHSFIVAAQTY